MPIKLDLNQSNRNTLMRCISYAYAAAAGIAAAAGFALCMSSLGWAIVIGILAGCITYWNTQGFQCTKIEANLLAPDYEWNIYKFFALLLTAPIFIFSALFEFLVGGVQWLLIKLGSSDSQATEIFYLSFFIPDTIFGSIFCLFGFVSWLEEITNLPTLCSTVFTPIGWFSVAAYCVLTIPFALATTAASTLEEIQNSKKIEGELNFVFRAAIKIFAWLMQSRWNREYYRLWGSFWHAMEHSLSIISCIPADWVLSMMINPGCFVILSSAIVVLVTAPMFLETYYFDGEEFEENTTKLCEQIDSAESPQAMPVNYYYFKKDILLPSALFLHAIADTFPALFLFSKVLLPAVSIAACWAYLIVLPVFIGILSGLYYSEYRCAQNKLTQMEKAHLQRNLLPFPAVLDNTPVGPLPKYNTQETAQNALLHETSYGNKFVYS